MAFAAGGRNEGRTGMAAYKKMELMTRQAPARSVGLGRGPRSRTGARSPVRMMAPAVAKPFQMLSAYLITTATRRPPKPGLGWVVWGATWAMMPTRQGPCLRLRRLAVPEGWRGNGRTHH
eukprot:scaffold63505_cov28-Tisochrysis_lutea.AAC.6